MARLKGKNLAAIFDQGVLGAGNGSTTAFTLPSTPHSSAAVIVLLNGIPQVQTTDYSISGTTVTFTSAPATGRQVFAWYVKKN